MTSSARSIMRARAANATGLDTGGSARPSACSPARRWSRAPHAPGAATSATRAGHAAGGGAADGGAAERSFHATPAADARRPLFCCGKGPAFGQSRSHSMVATKRRFDPNLQKVRIFRASRSASTACTRCLKAGKVTKAPRAAGAAQGWRWSLECRAHLLPASSAGLTTTLEGIAWTRRGDSRHWPADRTHEEMARNEQFGGRKVIEVAVTDTNLVLRFRAAVAGALADLEHAARRSTT